MFKAKHLKEHKNLFVFTYAIAFAQASAAVTLKYHL